MFITNVFTKTIRRKLFMVVGIISIIPLLFIEVYTYSYFKNASINMNIVIQRLLTEKITNNINKQFELAQSLLNYLAYDNNIIKALDTNNLESLNRILEDTVANNPLFYSIIVCNSEGSVIAVNPQTSIFYSLINSKFAEFSKIDNNNLTISNFQKFSVANKFIDSIYISLPIRSSNQLNKNYIIAFLDYRQLQKAIAEGQIAFYKEGFKSGILQIIDEERGEVIISSTGRKTEEKEKYWQDINEKKYSLEYQKNTWLAIKNELSFGYKKIYLFTMVLEEDVLVATNEMFNITVIVFTILVGIIMILIFFVAKSITLPLVNIVNLLKETAEGKGDINKKVDVKSKDEVGLLSDAFNQMITSFRKIVEQAKSIANGDFSTTIVPKSEQDILGLALFNMTNQLRVSAQKNKEQLWIKNGLSELAQKIRGEQDIAGLARNIINYLAVYLDCKVGTVYIVGEDNLLHLYGNYAFEQRKELANIIKMGEGIVGQVALEKQSIVLTNLPENYMYIKSSTGESSPKYLIAFPLVFEEILKGVIELASFSEFDEVKNEFITQISEPIAVAFSSAQSRGKLQALLDETCRQSKELEFQQEELKATNEELKSQTEALIKSEESLKEQQEELKATNEELEEKSEILEQQRDEIKLKNEDLEKAGILLEQKANELEIATKYKSEFLANMSHELRTPLNSILILSQLLAENKESTLTPEQRESALTINQSGTDLLTLINDILDLSKVEAGQLDIYLEKINLVEIGKQIEKLFKPLAEKKSLEFKFIASSDLPQYIYSDGARIKQILRNFISNSMKFTHKGSVKIIFRMPGKNEDITPLTASILDVIVIDVTDTGIGISKDKQDIIFEAFKQADGSTTRQYGGTGLGLSITRALTDLLGGTVKLKSSPSEGSTFSVYLPINAEQSININSHGNLPNETQIYPNVINKNKITEAPIIKLDTRKLLIVEDDINTQKSMGKLFEGKDIDITFTGDGATCLDILKDNIFDVLILDLCLPDIPGFELLEKIKSEKKFSSLSVIIYTSKDLNKEEVEKIKRFAKSIIVKGIQSNERLVDETLYYLKDGNRQKSKITIPALIKEDLSQDIKDSLQGKKVLICDDDMKNMFTLNLNLKEKGMQILMADNITLVEDIFTKNPDISIVIIDILMSNEQGYEIIKNIRKNKKFAKLPILVIGSKELDQSRNKCLNLGANDCLDKPFQESKLYSMLKIWLTS